MTDYYEGTLSPNHFDPYPSIRLFAGIKDCSGPMLGSSNTTGIAQGSSICKFFESNVSQNSQSNTLNGRSDTVGRAHLSLTPDSKPAWTSLYKPHLMKKLADLQWRVLHGIRTVNVVVSVINTGVGEKCPFCKQRETVFHCFSDCVSLSTLYVLLRNIFSRCGEVFTKHLYLWV